MRQSGEKCSSGSKASRNSQTYALFLCSDVLRYSETACRLSTICFRIFENLILYFATSNASAWEDERVKPQHHKMTAAHFASLGVERSQNDT